MDSKVQIITRIKDYLNMCISEKRFLRDSSAFSRKPTLDFQHVVLFLLSLPKLSLAISLDKFLEECFDHCSPIMSKSSLSKARYKLRHTFFLGANCSSNWCTKSFHLSVGRGISCLGLMAVA